MNKCLCTTCPTISHRFLLDMNGLIHLYVDGNFIFRHSVVTCCSPVILYYCENMGGSVENGGGSTVSVVTFTIEMLLYTAILTGTCWFAANYFSVFRIPALVFMFLDTVSVMIAVHTVIMMLIFSVRHKSAHDAFSDSVLSDFSQGFTVVCSLLWLLVLICMFLDVPRIAAVPGFPSTASIISLAIVLGISSVIPLLSFIVTYAAVPDGAQNSLMFNGASVGAFSLLFFVIVSFGSGGVMKCAPYEGSGVIFIFCMFVFVYWILLYLIEVFIFFNWKPLQYMWDSLTGGGDGQYNRQNSEGVVKLFDISFWRIPGCLLNMVIVATTMAYSQPAIHGTVGVVVVVVALVHIPLIIVINVDYWLIEPDVAQPAGVEVSEISNHNNLHYDVAARGIQYPMNASGISQRDSKTAAPFVQTFPPHEHMTLSTPFPQLQNRSHRIIPGGTANV
jgi:hypothetical protein